MGHMNLKNTAPRMHHITPFLDEKLINFLGRGTLRCVETNFYSRDAMLVGVIVMTLCLSVCLSVTCRCSIETDRRIELIFGLFRPILRGVLGKFRYLEKSEYFRLELFPKLRTQKISPRHIDRRTCYQLSSRKVDARSVINWAVVGQLSLQYFRAATLDYCSLSQCSSSSVYSTILSRGSISDS